MKESKILTTIGIVVALQLCNMRIIAQESKLGYDSCNLTFAEYYDNNQELYESVKVHNNFKNSITKRGMDSKDSYQSGDTFADNGLTYRVINTNALEVQVGSGSFESNNISGSIDIPAFVVAPDGNSYSVTAIGDYAFYSARQLTSVSLPN